MDRAAENKLLMQGIFSELARGNGKPFVASLADDVRWTLNGTTPWSRTYAGKQVVVSELLQPLYAKFADQYTAVAQRIIADDDHVVVEARGRVMTKAGMRYDNAYCYVFRIADGKVQELTEYFDTELVTKALGDPLSAA